MSNNWNRFFNAEPKGYLQEHFMTAVGIRRLAPGPQSFDIHHQVVQGYKIARVDAWDASSRDDEPLDGYWVPQGQSCLIPRVATQSRHVFTADFSGCSILVDQVSPNQYRVYHVQGGSSYIYQEYLEATQYSHGLGLAAAMTFGDYAAACNACKTLCGREQTRGFAFLKFESGRWWIYVQGQNGVGIYYRNGQFALTGPQTISGGVRIPVADLTREVPRVFGRHDRTDLPVPTRRSVYSHTPAAAQLGAYTPARAKQARIFSRYLPNDELW